MLQIVVWSSKMASYLSFSWSDLPEIPSSPRQPSSTYTLPKQCFGNKVIVQRSCQRLWFERWPFLHYDKGQGKDVVFCHTCVTGFRQKVMKCSKTDPAFVSSFFTAYTIFLIGRPSTICVRFHLCTECICRSWKDFVIGKMQPNSSSNTSWVPAVENLWSL